MTPDIIVAAIAALAVVGASWATSRGAAWARVRDVEARMDRLELALGAERDYSQVLRDHIYKGLGPPPPARPAAEGGH